MGDPPWEVNTISDTHLLQGGFDCLFQLPVATDEHAEILVVAEDGGECPDEMLDAFFRTHPADVADEEGAVFVWGGHGEGGKVEEVLAGDEDFVAVGGEVP